MNFRNSVKKAALGIFLGAFLSGGAFAQTIETTTQQTSGSPSSIPFSLSDYSMFFGPSLNHPLTGKTIDSVRGKDAEGHTYDAYTGLSSRHFISGTFRLDERVSIIPVIDFNYILTDPNHLGGDRFSMNDPYIRLRRSGLVEQKVNLAGLSGSDVALDGDVRYYVPVSKISRDQGNAGSFRATLYPSLTLGNTGFSLSNESYARAWVQPRGAEQDMPMFRLYTGPQLNYTMNKHVTAFVLYEALANWGTLGSTDSELAYQTDVEPGLEIKVIDRLTLIPFLNWYPAQSIATTSVNLNADIRLF